MIRAALLLLAAVILMATGQDLWRWIVGPVLVCVAAWISFPEPRPVLISWKGKP